MSRDKDMYLAGFEKGYQDGLKIGDMKLDAQAVSWKRTIEWLIRNFERTEGVTGVSWGDPCPEDFTQGQWDFVIAASDAAMEQRPSLCEPFPGFVDLTHSQPILDKVAK